MAAYACDWAAVRSNSRLATLFGAIIALHKRLLQRCGRGEMKWILLIAASGANDEEEEEEDPRPNGSMQHQAEIASASLLSFTGGLSAGQ